jgi:hypothetical protein
LAGGTKTQPTPLCSLWGHHSPHSARSLCCVACAHTWIGDECVSDAFEMVQGPGRAAAGQVWGLVLHGRQPLHHDLLARNVLLQIRYTIESHCITHTHTHRATSSTASSKRMTCLCDIWCLGE